MKDPRIPLYLITGFLDSGKTTLLTDTLNMDYFADGQRTVLLMCEDGETEYDPEQLSRLNTRLVPVQDQAQLNTSFLQEIDRRYQPERVLLEYNGMWPIQILRDLKLPKTWGLYQAIDVIDGSTFEMYRSNMQSMVIDMVTEADMVLFNRCTPDMPLSGWKRSIRAVNRMCEIVFEDEEGRSWRWRTSSPTPWRRTPSSLRTRTTASGTWTSRSTQSATPARPWSSGPRP